jgi:hypothetical protein
LSYAPNSKPLFIKEALGIATQEWFSSPLSDRDATPYEHFNAGWDAGLKYAAPIDNVAEAEVCDEYIDTEAVADARKIWRALNDLSFDCFAGIGLRSPSIQVYNDTFKLMDSYRSTYGALIPDTQAKKAVRSQS